MAGRSRKKAFGKSVRRKRLKTKFVFRKMDYRIPGFGGYAAGSLTSGEANILFGMDALIEAYQGEPNANKDFRDNMLFTLTHEFCHSMQEFLEKEYDEYEVDKILAQINPAWDAPRPEEYGEVFSIEELLQFFNAHRGPGLEEAMRELLEPHRLHIEANKKDNAERLITKNLNS